MTHTTKMLEKIETELEELTLKVQSYSIGTRTMANRRIEELLKLRNYYLSEVNKEKVRNKQISSSIETRFE